MASARVSIKNDVSDKTVLADMVAFGKSFYFAKHMLPCVPDSVLIWYTPEEIKGSRSNEDLIWKRFVDSQVLYSTNHKVKQDYLGERPGDYPGWRKVSRPHWSMGRLADR